MGIKEKLRSSKGFSLAETLLAVLILLLVSVIVANGVPAARNAYEKVIVASNAQALLSTTANALRDELGTAWDVKKESKTSVSYYSTNTGSRSVISLNEEGEIMINEYVDTDLLAIGGTEGLRSRKLVSDATVTSDLAVTYESLDVKEDSVTFTGLKSGRKEKLDSPLIRVDMTVPVISAITDGEG